ncbi:MAG TPA: hypothetical protein VGE77_10845, partial [Nocardioides sp.]
MKIILGLLSGLFLVVAVGAFGLAFLQFDEDVTTGWDQECISPLVAEGQPPRQLCDARDESAGPTTFALLGGSSLVAGAVLALASVSVRGAD